MTVSLIGFMPNSVTDTFEKANSKVSLGCLTSDVATESSDVEREKSRRKRYDFA